MEMIYHYTTLKAFIGMLHTPTDIEVEEVECNKNVDWSYYLEFHASDVRMMNDKRENALINDALRDFPKNMRSSVYLTVDANKVYSISFCKLRDYIPMWNMYAKNGEDIGICLGFKADEFEKKISKITEGLGTFKLGECKYLTEMGIKRKVCKYRKEIKRISNGLVTDANTRFATEKLQQLMMESSFCKLNDFEYEKEVRLIRFTPQDSLIKKGRYGIAPYSVIKVPLTLLSEIIISPFAPNGDLTQIGIIELLRNRGYDKVLSQGLLQDLTYAFDINVELSKIELR